MEWKNPLQELKNLLRVQQFSAWNGRTHNKPLQKRKNPSWIGRTQPDYRRSHQGTEEPTLSTQDPTMKWRNPLRLQKIPPWIGRTQPDYRNSHQGTEEPTLSTQDPIMEWKNPLRLQKVPPWIGRTQPDYRRSHQGTEEPTLVHKTKKWQIEAKTYMAPVLEGKSIGSDQKTVLKRELLIWKTKNQATDQGIYSPTQGRIQFASSSQSKLVPRKLDPGPSCNLHCYKYTKNSLWGCYGLEEHDLWMACSQKT